jgi:nitrogenase molybdenum-iron protein alpha/beta subunit
MSAVVNRHPADRLADVRSEIKRLEAEEAQLRAYLLEHPADRTGEEHIAIIGSQSRRRVDLRGLADEIGASILQRFTTFGTAMVVRLQQRTSQ